MLGLGQTGLFVELRVAFQLVSLRERNLSRDWTQQELAEFYRVESVLGAAGIAVEMDRGLSDEGDPWFAFCRPQNGDVIIHFARYDGTYIAASGALGQVLRGRNFRELVDAFIARQPLVMPGQNQPNSVVLHPSALLTALVATALFLLDHQTADAAPILIDVDLDRAATDDHAAAEPANKFAALINLLVEPLRPHEQREAMLAIGAIVAGIAALAFDAAKDSPTIVPAIELATDDQRQDALQIEGDRLAQLNQTPARKMADAENQSHVQSDQTDETSAGTAKIVITDLTKAQTVASADATLAQHGGASEAGEKDVATIAFDGDLAALDLPNLMRPLTIHDIEASRGRDGGEAKLAATQQAQAPASPAVEAVTTVHIPAEKAEFLLQDSIAASLTKTIGAGAIVHLSFVEASTVPQLTSGELSRLIAEASDTTLASTSRSMSNAALSMTTVAATDAIVTEGATTTKLSAAEQKAMDAISFFAQSNPDFKITQLGKDIILFDFEARPDNKIVYDVHSWSLPDGSKITIIGALPDGLNATA